MRIGVPRERKDGERRVGLVPDGVAWLAQAGHQVTIEQGAGERAGFGDAAYAAAGAQIARDGATVFQCEFIVKVKEPQRFEWPLLVPGTTLCGFAQFGRDRDWLDAALAARIGYIAYETVTDADGALPLLAPMSRIAGALAGTLLDGDLVAGLRQPRHAAGHKADAPLAVLALARNADAHRVLP